MKNLNISFYRFSWLDSVAQKDTAIEATAQMKVYKKIETTVSLKWKHIFANESVFKGLSLRLQLFLWFTNNIGPILIKRSILGCGMRIARIFN